MFSDISFFNPSALLLLLLVPLGLAFFIWRGMVRAATIRRIGNEELIKGLLKQVSFFRRHFKSFLWLVTIAALAIALARPLWGVESQIIEVPDLDIIFAVDVSRSMDAQDISPSRLDRAKFDMLDILRQLPTSEKAIVLFAYEAFRYMPLTNSNKAAEIFMNGISTNAISAQGTNIRFALNTALNLVEERQSGQAVIILISDGEHWQGDMTEALERANQNEVIIHTIGYGTPAGAIIPLYDENGVFYDYKLDENGELVITRLEEELMQEVAATTGGLYLPVKTNEPLNITELLNAIRALREASMAAEVRNNPIERFYIFVALALVSLFSEMIIPEARRR